MIFHTMAILWHSVRLAWNHTIVWCFYDLHVAINFYGTLYDFNVFIDHTINDFLWFPCFLYGSKPGSYYATCLRQIVSKHESKLDRIQLHVFGKKNFPKQFWSSFCLLFEIIETLKPMEGLTSYWLPIEKV